MARAKKGDLITDLAGQLLSGSGVNLDTLLDVAGNKLPQILNKGSQYPQLSAANLKALRTRFKRNIPQTLTKAWIAEALGTTQSNAEKVILPSLDLLGIISAQGKTTARAAAFAKEDSYTSAVRKMINDVYPEELRALNIGTKTEQTKISSFFKKAASNNQTVAKRMESIYLHLVKESEGTVMAASSDKTAKDSKTTPAKNTDKKVSLTVRLDFPSKKHGTAVR